MPVYLDCNATSPMEDVVFQEVRKFLVDEFGNAGSRTHGFGARANRAVQQSRASIAAVVAAQVDEVFFTSGATESNNIALLGLRQFGEDHGMKHIVSTRIEHKAVLEPMEVLEKQGFEVDLVEPTSNGWVKPGEVERAVREDTLLVSMMQVNNETGVIQLVPEVAEILGDHAAFLHVDAAQGFGKDLCALRNDRIDLISVSGHKIYGPKGIGALVARRRGYQRPPLTPLSFGGGQERGLRPGTLPVPLIAGLGKAAELCLRDASARAEKCAEFKRTVMQALAELGPRVHGDQARTMSHVVNLSFPNLDSEAVMLAVKDHIAVSNGSACTSASYEPSHVLKVMGLEAEDIQGAIRISWCHMTEEVDWDGVVMAIKRLM